MDDDALNLSRSDEEESDEPIRYRPQIALKAAGNSNRRPANVVGTNPNQLHPAGPSSQIQMAPTGRADGDQSTRTGAPRRSVARKSTAHLASSMNSGLQYPAPMAEMIHSQGPAAQMMVADDMESIIPPTRRQIALKSVGQPRYFSSLGNVPSVNPRQQYPTPRTETIPSRRPGDMESIIPPSQRRIALKSMALPRPYHSLGNLPTVNSGQQHPTSRAVLPPPRMRVAPQMGSAKPGYAARAGIPMPPPNMLNNQPRPTEHQGTHLTTSTVPIERRTYETMPHAYPTKNAPIRPSWQRADDAFAETLTPQRRKADADMRWMDIQDSSRRISMSSAARVVRPKVASSQPTREANAGPPAKRPKVRLKAGLKLYVGNQLMNEDSNEEDSTSGSSDEAESPPPVAPPVRFGARKNIMVPDDSDPSSSSSESEPEDTASEPGTETPIQQLSDSGDEDSTPEVEHNLQVPQERSPSLPPLDYATPRPQAPPTPNQTSTQPPVFVPLDIPSRHKDIERPADELLEAMAALSLSELRMQQSHCLPFLRRNLRVGFLSRCARLGVDTRIISSSISILVKFTLRDSTPPKKYETVMKMWLCPLCRLHGPFNNRAMLSKHLKWNHSEITSTWQRIRSQAVRNAWELSICMPNPDDVPSPQPEVRYSTTAPAQTPTTVTLEERTASVPASYPPADIPSVPIRAHTQRDVKHLLQPLAKQEPHEETPDLSELSLSTVSSVPPSVTETSSDDLDIPIRASESERFPSPARTIAPPTQPTTAPQNQQLSKYPIPPPKSNSLGPAAVPPYLPAVSEYGGPTVKYSCRPGGACLYDLLGTLPMDEYGVLAWAVLDREEEIYESDDVKEEYKVMHALWARWIFLNRNVFIANYYLGALKFVEYYWKMIHRAAGWEALRYWLLMLVGNRFLTGHDVARILKAYEGLVLSRNGYMV